MGPRSGGEAASKHRQQIGDFPDPVPAGLTYFLVRHAITEVCAMSTNTFLGLAERLLADPSAKGAYAADPQGFLEAEGFGALSPDEVSTGLRHVAQVLPPSVAEAVDPDAGLDGLAELDLARLGVDGLDDFSTPLEVDDLDRADDLDDIDGLDRAVAPELTEADDSPAGEAAAEATDDGDGDAISDDDLDDRIQLVAEAAPPQASEPIDDGGPSEPTFVDIDEPSFAEIDADEPALDTEVPEDERWDLFDL